MASTKDPNNVSSSASQPTRDASPSMAGVFTYSDWFKSRQHALAKNTDSRTADAKAVPKVADYVEAVPPPPFVLFEGYAIVAEEDYIPEVPEADYAGTELKESMKNIHEAGNHVKSSAIDTQVVDIGGGPKSSDNEQNGERGFSSINPSVPEADYSEQLKKSNPTLAQTQPFPSIQKKKTVLNSARSDGTLDGSIHFEIVEEKKFYHEVNVLLGPPGLKFEVPDRGYGWIVVGAAFTCLFTVLGTQYSFGLLYVLIKDEFKPSSELVSSFVGSIPLAMFLFIGAPVGRLIELFGCRLVTQAGAVIVSLSLLASSYVGELWHLFFTYGICAGAGFGISYGPALIMIGQYFAKKRALATSIAVSGSGFGTLILSFVVRTIQNSLDNRWRLFLRFFLVPFSFFSLLIAGSLYKPLQKSLRRRSSEVKGGPSFKWTKFFDFPFLMTNPYVKYLCLSVAISSLGYFVPVIYTISYAKSQKISSSLILYLTPLYGGGSIVGRIVFGKLAQGPVLKRLFLYGLTITVAGFSAILLGAIMTFTDNANVIFAVFCIFQVLYGMFAGAYIALLPVISADLCGIQNLTRALGLAYTSQALFVAIGPPIAGLFKDLYSFHAAYIITGCVLIFSIVPLLIVPNIFRDAEKLIDQPKTRTERSNVVTHSAGTVF